MAAIPDYAELRCVSNFSFLRGASQPEELVERAKQLGYTALAIADECSMSGIVRAHTAAKQHQLKLLVGSQFLVDWGIASLADTTPFDLTVLACNLHGYGNLCQFITKLRRSAPKGTYHLDISNITGDELADCVVLASPKRMSEPAQLATVAKWLLNQFIGRCWFGADLLRILTDEMWLHRLREVSGFSAIPLVAAGDVHFHVRSRKPLQDVLTATRVGKPLTECGLDLQPNSERHLRTRLRLAQTYPEELLAETLNVAARCVFSLDELRYQYPDEVVPSGETPASYLRRITYEGAGRRWPGGMAAKVQSQIEHELELIGDLQYEHYFLTVADIVAFARSRHILCQGRGSAANSVVCYCIGVTEVDPARMSMLFERFISKERNEPPDIDIDFEHERREEVLQYLYTKYGRDRAALTGVVISYRPKSAIRDVGKALGFSLQTVDAIAKGHVWWDGKEVKKERLEELGLSLDDLQVRQLLHLTEQLLRFPRHLSQHTGGFVLTKGPLSRMVPIENASMVDRTVLQWDKDDLDALGLLKVDCLALGMLTAIRKSLEFIGTRKGYVFEMQDIPAEDTETYDMVCQADTVGVFQIESRAQMSMLPRLRPRCFYDLVIEVAIVRPGPIVGGMVHPYLNRRQGKEPVTYPSEALKEALGRTLGIPVFQEQVMQISILAAGFTPGEADGLRRAMAAWKRKGGLDRYYDKIVDGMTSRGYDKAFAEAIFKQIHGFSEYGFPESHAASFALLVYASCWIKKHHPAEFLAAMLNSQPLGFYSPSQLVQDAKRHGVEVRAADVMVSHVDCTLEDLPHPPAVRLGLRMISGLQSESMERVVAARQERVFDSAEDLARRARIEHHEMKALAGADALMSLSGHRRQARPGPSRPTCAVQAAVRGVDGPRQGDTGRPGRRSGAARVGGRGGTRRAGRRVKTYIVAVRALCDFAAKQGDLDLRFTPSPTSQQGIAGHQTVAASRSATYRSEVSLSGAYRHLVVRGRADGYDAQRQLLEEVKTFKGDLDLMPANHRQLHWAQAKVYGALLCRQFDLAELTVSLVYFDIGRQQEVPPQSQQCTANELQAFFEALCERFIAWADSELVHRERRDTALTSLKFPHENFRAGQRDLAKAVFNAARLGRCLLGQAPTGIGKTIATLFPMLKACPEQELDKVFFLTAKGSGRSLALNALETLRQSDPAMPLRVVELVARDKSCEHPDKVCHGDSCPLAKGFYDRLPAARTAAVSAGTLTRDSLREIALAHAVCPYFLGQEVARWCDVIVGDYNHFFDSTAMLHGLTLANAWRVGVLVDEAHNLVDRARAMYSASLSSAQLRSVRAAAPPTLKKPLDRLQRSWTR